MLVAKAEKGNLRLEVFADDGGFNPREDDNLSTIVCAHGRYSLGDEQAENIELYESWDEWLENEVLKPNGGADEVVFLPVYMYDHSGITINTVGFTCRWDSGQLGYIYCTKERFRKETGWKEDELFSKDIHRTPVVGEHVKVKGYEDRGSYCGGFGKVVSYNGTDYTVDFDWGKALNFKNPENIVQVSADDILEVMSNRAEQMLRDEIELYDMYLRGECYQYSLSRITKCECCGEEVKEEVDSCGGFLGTDWKNNGLADAVGDIELIEALEVVY